MLSTCELYYRWILAKRKTFVACTIMAIFAQQMLSQASYQHWQQQQQHIINTCKMLYSNTAKMHQYMIIPKILNPQQCLNLIKEAESYAQQHHWTTRRHESYPTYDNQLSDNWASYPLIEQMVQQKVAPKIAAMFAVDADKIGINEIFVVKYTLQAQRSLALHRDGCEFSFILALNADYSGGGTYLKPLNKKVNLTPGDMLIFPGQLEHQGLPIDAGTRYIVVGFLNYAGEDFCTEHIEYHDRSSPNLSSPN